MSAAATHNAARKSSATSRQAVMLGTYLVVCALAAAISLYYLTPQNASGLRDLESGLWTMAVGIVCNSSCTILGCYLVLRRMSLLGDAISHAVLPGIALGYLFSGSVAGLPILLGAMALGMVTSALTQGLSQLGKVPEDTSLGVVFTSLFAVGVIMLQSARNVDLDADCVLYGLIDFAGYDFKNFFGVEVSRPLVKLLPALGLTLLLVAVFWKELKIVAFDSGLAAAMGFRVSIVHYLLMAMVSAVTVASFEAVGSILVVAMLVVPAATAALLSERLVWMMAWAVAIGATSAVFGYLLAVTLATSVAGAVGVIAGVQFALAVFLSPRSGLISRWIRNQSLAVRIAAEDILARLYRQEESGARSQGSGAGSHDAASLVQRLACWRLSRAGWIETDTRGNLQLTDAGRSAARSLVRAHRLWESYLDTHFDLPRDHLHDAAERLEHFLGPELQENLAAELAHRPLDPHGKQIPPPTGASSEPTKNRS